MNDSIKQIKALFEVSKFGILRMNLVTFSYGFFLAKASSFQLKTFILALLGTALSSAGAAALNNYLERNIDAKMERTKQRCLPQKTISPEAVLLYGFFLCLLGVFVLSVFINPLAAFLSFLTIFLYVIIYTPFKKITWINTYIGAIPGALIPLGGWAAAVGHLESQAFILFAILFTWQLPHFFALAWLYKDDYQKAGFKMLSSEDQTGSRTTWQILVHTGLLIGFSLLPVLTKMTHSVYLIGSFCIGALFLMRGIQFALDRSKGNARKVFLASVLYLPVLLVLILVDPLLK